MFDCIILKFLVHISIANKTDAYLVFLIIIALCCHVIVTVALATKQFLYKAIIFLVDLT